MTASHTALKEVARQILGDMGYTSEQIQEEYHVSLGSDYEAKKTFRVDVVGLGEKRIAIECGSTPGEKIAALKMFFDEVIVLPYFKLNIEQLEYETTIRKQNQAIKSLTEQIQELQHEQQKQTNKHSIIQGLFEDCLEVFYRLMNEHDYYTVTNWHCSRFFNKNITDVVEDLDRKIGMLKEFLNAKLQTEANQSPS